MQNHLKGHDKEILTELEKNEKQPEQKPQILKENHKVIGLIKKDEQLSKNSNSKEGGGCCVDRL